MKRSLFCFALTVPLVCAAYASADNDVKYSSGMTAVNVADVSGEGINVAEGTYLAAGAKQMRITNSQGAVRLFKGQLPNNDPSVAQLRDGDILEYSGTIYLTSITPRQSDKEQKSGTIIDNEADIHELANGRESALSPLRYNPARTVSLMQLLDGCCTVIDRGRITVYNRYGERFAETYRSYASELSGYILNENINSVSGRDKDEAVVVIDLVGGQEYRIGKDIEAGAYEGSGSGVVRVYNPAGYPKTVIKLKKSGKSSEDGVESYIFRLDENEAIITEGSIRFIRTDNTN